MSPLDIVTFRLDGQLCGVDTREVLDVFRPICVTPVPLARGDVLGVLNLRGRIVTAICARRRLGIADRAPSAPEPKAIGMECGGDHYGLVVDCVEGVLKLDEADLIPPPERLSQRWSHIVQGVFRMETELMILLSGRALIFAEAQAA